MSDQGKSQTYASRQMKGNILTYLERNRGKPQYRHAPSAAVSANKIVRPLAKKFGPGKSALQNHWPQIIGEKWAALSRPVTIRGGREGKTLVIEAKGPAAAMMQANTGQLLGQINQFLGKGTIVKIMVKQGSFKIKPKADTAPKPTLPAKRQSPQKQSGASHMRSALENLPENALQDALNALGDHVHARPNKHK